MRDLRQELFGAQDWVAELISNTKPEQYSLPTPCSEFTVKDLLDHYMCGVCDKIESFPVDRTPAETRTVDDYLQEWNASSQRARAVWTDEAMHRDYTMSWGAVHSGPETVGIYLFEMVCHGYDLAYATGQSLEGPEAVAQAALEAAIEIVSNYPREETPYDPETRAPENAGPTVALAAFLGRDVS